MAKSSPGTLIVLIVQLICAVSCGGGGGTSSSGSPPAAAVSTTNCSGANVSVPFSCSAAATGMSEVPTWSLENNSCAWLGITATTGTLSGTPDQSDYGSCAATLKATGTSSSATTTLTLNVSRKLVGAIDTSFNSNGVFTISEPGGSAEHQAMAVDQLGRVIVAFQKWTDGKTYLKRYLRGSHLEDPSFNSYVAFKPFGFRTEFTYIGVDQNNNIYLASVGEEFNGDKGFTKIRKLSGATGAVDATYGVSGVATVKFFTYTSSNLGDRVNGMRCDLSGVCYLYGGSFGRAAIAAVTSGGSAMVGFGNYPGMDALRALRIEGLSRFIPQISSIGFLANGTLMTSADYDATGDTAFSVTGLITVLSNLDPLTSAQDSNFGIQGSRAFNLVATTNGDRYRKIAVDAADNVFVASADSTSVGSPLTFKFSLNKLRSTGTVSEFNAAMITVTGYGQPKPHVLIDQINSRVYMMTSYLDSLAGTDKIHIRAYNSTTGALESDFGTSGTFALTVPATGFDSYTSAKEIKFDGYGRLILSMRAVDGSSNEASVVVVVK